MELREIEERVQATLQGFNAQAELCDYRPTWFNQKARADLDEACYDLSAGRYGPDELKPFLRAYRDACAISYIDFRIKVSEPGPGEFNRMALLFGPLTNDVRLLPPRDAEAREDYRRTKILKAMRLIMETKQAVSEKLRQQFSWLMVRYKTKPPQMLAVAVEFESYNPYQKRLNPAPGVVMTNHFAEETMQETKPAPEPMFAPETIDNSAFEARLPATPAKASKKPWVDTYKPTAEPMPVRVTLAPHELPAEIHEEFAAYCRGLYEKAKNH